MLIYRSRRAVSQNDKQNIRVWRSLVSRLNGVQEAAGSNPVTRTKKWELPFGNSHFLFCGWIRTHSNATCRGHVAGRRSRRRPHLHFHSQRNGNVNRIRHSDIQDGNIYSVKQAHKNRKSISSFGFYFFDGGFEPTQMRQSGGLSLDPVEPGSTPYFFLPAGK